MEAILLPPVLLSQGNIKADVNSLNETFYYGEGRRIALAHIALEDGINPSSEFIVHPTMATSTLPHIRLGIVFVVVRFVWFV